MSKRNLILAGLALCVLAAAIGGYVSAPTSRQAAAPASQLGAQDEAAKAASRAMTFTQPKAGAQ